MWIQVLITYKTDTDTGSNRTDTDSTVRTYAETNRLQKIIQADIDANTLEQDCKYEEIRFHQIETKEKDQRGTQGSCRDRILIRSFPMLALRRAVPSLLSSQPSLFAPLFSRSVSLASTYSTSSTSSTTMSSPDLTPVITGPEALFIGQFKGIHYVIMREETFDGNKTYVL